MNVNSSSASYGATATQAPIPPQSNGIQNNEDMFMRMLVNQITHQDPANPLDGNQIANQFAQMSQTQSLNSVAKITANSNTLMSNLQVLSTASLVGQNVMVQTDSIELADKSLNARITLQHPAGAVTVYLKDRFGTDHKLALGPLPAGEQNFTVDPQKNGLPPGKYTLDVVTDSGEKSVPVEFGGTVKVVRISPLNGDIALNISGLGDVSFTRIRQFGSASASSARS